MLMTHRRLGRRDLADGETMSNPSARFDVVGCAVVAMFFGEHEEAHLRMASEVLDDLPPSGPSCMVVFIGPHAKAPDAKARAHYAQMIDRLAPRSLGTVRIVPGKGFLAAVQRGVIAGLDLLTRGDVPAKVVDSVDDALAWLSTQRRVDRDTVDAVRAHIERECAAQQADDALSSTTPRPSPS